VHIPRIWAKANADVTAPDRRPLALVAWGWGDDEAQAKREASSRLDRIVQRVRRGEPFPERYAYGDRPLREEILQTFDGVGESEPRAILTRNAYGATVLNTARLLFLDIDTGAREEGLGQKLGRLFGGGSKEDPALVKLRETLRNAGKGAFRIYRTAGGYRALAVEREFDPASREAHDLMKATGTDPFYIRLCNAQKSFRARLTPKPWRMEMKAPPWEYPRTDPAHQRRFEEWLAEYEQASSKYATCKFLEALAKGPFVGMDDNDLVAIHDRMTRAMEPLPLA
jgi:hypothetical protein